MAVYSAEQIPPTLRLAFKQRRLIPFLGAGFSAPLQLPTWGELVGWMADKLGWERELFELHGTYPQLAEFFSLEPQAFDDLVHEMTRRFDAPEVDERRRSSPTHRALAAFPWKTIYTTNYDGHVEGAMKDAGRRVHVLASLSDFLQTSRAEEACEVVKFHGTLRLKETIVLSESHYFARMDLNAAVDQRLRADLLGNSFLFIGYGFADANIRYIWYRMNKLLAEQRSGAEPLRSYFVSFGVDPVQPKLLARWNIDVIQLDPRDKGRSVAELLASIGEER